MERCLSALMQQATDDLGTPACDTKKLFPAGPEQGVGRRSSCPGHCDIGGGGRGSATGEGDLCWKGGFRGWQEMSIVQGGGI